MLNPRYDDLPVYPFDRLRHLLDAHTPAKGMAPISLAVGDPTFDPPAAIAETMADKSPLMGPLSGNRRHARFPRRRRRMA